MALTVLTDIEKRIAGIKKSSSSVAVIPNTTIKQIQSYRAAKTTATKKKTTNTTTNTTSSGGGGSTATTTSNSSSSNTVKATIGTKTESADWLDILGAVFPPAQLLNIGQLPVGTQTPTVTYEGTPEALNSLNGPSAGIVAEESTDLFGDLTNQFGGILKIAIPLIGLGFIASTMKSFKGLF